MFQRIFFIVLALHFFTLSTARADVWKDEREWEAKDEADYVKWVSSDSFNRRIFVEPTSPYVNLPTDCADVVYAARIIFAFEHKLNFRSYNSAKEDGPFWKRTISNNSNLFDKYPEGPQRVKAFITYLGKYSDTKFLASEDSYPVALKDIKAGDFYITEQPFGDTTIRHTYLIKKVYASGIFDLYYSTLPYMVRELKVHRGLPLFGFSSEPFGFRRFKAPFELNMTEAELPSFSLEQFDFVKKVGSDNVLAEISKKIRTEEEGLQGRLDRLIGNLCRSMDDRIEAISEAQRFLKTVNGRCVSAAEFDNYSTPVKDQRIKSQIDVLSQFWGAVVSQKRTAEFSKEKVAAMNFLTGLPNGNAVEHKKLCADYPQVPVTVKQYKDLFEAGKISSHPNDTVELRWGGNGIPTQCQNYY
jgi:hypothetical protein